MPLLDVMEKSMSALFAYNDPAKRLPMPLPMGVISIEMFTSPTFPLRFGPR